MEIATILRRLYEVFEEENYECERIADWELNPDDYAEFLESCRIGHRRVRAWVSEARAGATVTLTAKGAALFSSMHAAAPEAEERGDA